MSSDEWDEWYNRSRSVFDKFLEEIFREIAEMDRTLERFGPISPEDLERAQELGKLDKPFYYGFEYKLGPDGRPAFREFGNIKRKGLMPKIGEEIDPLTDVLERQDTISVIAELPGVEKENVKVSCDGRAMKLEAKSERRKYSKEIALPAEVDPKTGVAKYRNGILELTLKKKVPSPPSGEQIKVE